MFKSFVITTSLNFSSVGTSIRRFINADTFVDLRNSFATNTGATSAIDIRISVTTLDDADDSSVFPSSLFVVRPTSSSNSTNRIIPLFFRPDVLSHSITYGRSTRVTFEFQLYRSFFHPKTHFVSLRGMPHGEYRTVCSVSSSSSSWMYETEWSHVENDGWRDKSEKASNARSAVKGSWMRADTISSFSDDGSSSSSVPATVRPVVAVGSLDDSWARSSACRSRSSMSTSLVVVVVVC